MKIKITYYKPLEIKIIPFERRINGQLVYDTDNCSFDDLSNEDNLRWIDGQPYEIIILDKGETR